MWWGGADAGCASSTALPLQRAVCCFSSKTYISLSISADATWFWRTSPALVRLKHYYVCSHHDGNRPRGHKAQAILRHHLIRASLYDATLYLNSFSAATLSSQPVLLFFSHSCRTQTALQSFSLTSHNMTNAKRLSHQSEPKHAKRALMGTFKAAANHHWFIWSFGWINLIH